MKHSLKIGVTGGIGSGKSTVCKILETMGYPVYYSDERAKELTNTDPEIISAVKNAFGEDAYIEGYLNRAKISGIIFSQPEKRELLNSIVHPAVRADFFSWHEKQSSLLVFQESALLFETGNYKHFDRSILVTSPLELRIRRLLKRDNATGEQIRARIANQLSDEEKVKLAGFVVENDEQELIIPRIEKIIGKIKAG